jgi:outer membrane cobalamin receptor
MSTPTSFLRLTPTCLWLAQLCLCPLAWADGVSLLHGGAPLLSEIEVTDQSLSATGTLNAASQGVILGRQLQARPLQRPGDVLEHIPGLVVTQHSGDGKANQYFLRGINLDHGSDFATTVNGVPVNMPTHAHGQGYSDVNFLMPELVQRMHFSKGPYFAEQGDFSSAGSAHVVYRTRLDESLADLSWGGFGYQRALNASSRQVGEDLHLLGAVEVLNHNGPWTVAQGLRKRNVLFTFSGGTSARGWSTSLSDHSAHWRATDPVPQRLLDAGRYQGQAFGRFDSLDASDGARTSRTSLSGQWHDRDAHQTTLVSWYALRYDLDLYSNFTYQTASQGQGNSDQFGQRDQREVLGGQASHAWVFDGVAHTPMVNTVGVQFRQDRIDAGLFDTTQRRITRTVRDDQVRQRQLGVFGQNDSSWHDKLRTVAGLRLDQFIAEVDSRGQAENSGTSSSHRVSPKLSVILGPWAATELFVNTGHGFHSNDARGTTARVDPRSGAALTPTPGLVRSRGEELGLRTQVTPDWQTSLALWRLRFDSELTYLGDLGTTQAGRPSTRSGLEWTQQWTPRDVWRLNANLAWTRPRFTNSPADATAIPNAVRKMASLAATLQPSGPWSGSWGLRYIGPSALTADAGVVARAKVSSQLRVTRRLDPHADLSLDVLNLTNRRDADMQYRYTSQVAGEATPVDDTHLHPTEPRSFRLNLRIRYP